MNCPTCGAEQPNGAVFCDRCQAPLPAIETAGSAPAPAGEPVQPAPPFALEPSPPPFELGPAAPPIDMPEPAYQTAAPAGGETIPPPPGVHAVPPRPQASPRPVAPRAWDADTAPHAGFLLRVVASVIDSFIVTIGAFFLIFGLLVVFLAIRVDADSGAANGDLEDGVVVHDAIAPEAVALVLLMYLLVAGGTLLYYTLFEAFGAQATPGKRAVGIKVVGPGGGRVGFGRALGRNLTEFVAAAITGGLIYLVAAATKHKQGVHDMAAGTYVVQVK